MCSSSGERKGTYVPQRQCIKLVSQYTLCVLCKLDHVCKVARIGERKTQYVGSPSYNLGNLLEPFKVTGRLVLFGSDRRETSRTEKARLPST